MRKVQSRDLYALVEDGSFNRDETHWVYNGLDSAVTLRVHQALQPKLQASPQASLSYSFHPGHARPRPLHDEHWHHGPEQQVRQDETKRYTLIRDEAQALLDKLADAVWGPEHYIDRVRTKEVYTPTGKRGQPLAPPARTTSSKLPRTRPRGLNPGSNPQMLAFFNGALKMPVEYAIRKTAAGMERTPTANDKALAKWGWRNTKGPGVNLVTHRFDPPLAVLSVSSS